MKKTFIYSIFLIFVLLSGILNLITMKDSMLLNKVEEDLKYKGIVEEIKWQEAEESKYVVKVKNVQDEKFSYNINEKLMLKVIGEKDISLGDEISFIGKTKIPMTNTNPKLFNYKLRLLSDKIYTTMTIKDYSILEIKSENKGFKYRARIKFKEDIEKLFDNSLNKDNSSLVKSIVLGDYEYLEEEEVSKYRSLGLAHILAVSGLHIGIISGFLVLALSNLGVKRRKVYFLTLCIIWFYGYLIGFPTSLLRANIMMSILFLAKTLAEPYDSLNSLFLAFSILLIVNPFWIFSLGFQLSFMATASIIFLTPKIQRLFYPYKNNMVLGLSAILGVQLGLLPIQAYYFNEIPILSILANLFIAPILSLCLVIASSMIGLFYSISSLNKVLGVILNLILDVQFKLVNILNNIPYGKVTFHSPNISEFVLYYLILFILFKVIDLRKLKPNIKKVIVYYLIFYIIFSFIVMVQDESLEIHFIDVGQGDSILIKGKKGNYLIDTGGNLLASFDIGENILLPYLNKHGIRRLNGVFISHFHEDHSKSLPLLIDNLDIEHVFASYRNPSSKAYNHIIDKDKNFNILKEGNRLILDKNLSMEVLSPNDEFISRGLEENDLSLVLLLRYYNREILFTGDMEKEVENYLLDKLNRPIDIIKVPHHGSNTSSKEELLKKIKPKLGVIMAGRNNLYGHPREEVLERYNDLGTEIYRTDLMGMVKVRLNKDNMEIDYFLKDEISLYRLLNDYILIFISYLIYYLISYIFIKIYIVTEEGELT